MSSKLRAEDRLRRLLVILPWLMEVERVALEEVAVRFDMTEQEVVRDLELVAMCGLPPYVDEMIDVFIDDGEVFVGVPRLFRRTLRLTAPEAFSLLIAAHTALELPGAAIDGALRRGLDRVSSFLRDAGIEAPSVVVEDDVASGVDIELNRPHFAGEVITAVTDGAELRIDYFSPMRGDVAERTIVPRHVFIDRGNWYLRAHDVSGEDRTFRIDRIEAVERTGQIFPAASDHAAPPDFFTDRNVYSVTLRLAPAATWIIDRYPHDTVEPVSLRARLRPGPPGVPLVDVKLPVASDRWLARLLLRLGPDAAVVAPQSSADLGVELAAEVLKRYR